MSTIILTEGTIVSPLGPDLRPDTQGYDNAGLFGPAFANLGGEHFTLTWTLGPLAGPSYGWVQDVALTINGFTYDFGAVPPGDQVSAGGQYGIDAHGNLVYASFSSLLSTLPTGAPNFAGPSLLASYEIHTLMPPYQPVEDFGHAILAVRGHPWETVVNFAVPNPELGSGIVGLLMLASVSLSVLARHRRGQK